MPKIDAFTAFCGQRRGGFDFPSEASFVVRVIRTFIRTNSHFSTQFALFTE